MYKTVELNIYYDIETCVIRKSEYQLGNSTSKTPSLQNVSLKLAEILQAYSILKVMIFCKISASKSESGALCEFFKFSQFFASFLACLFNFDVPSLKCSKKISKNIFSM